MWHLKISWHLKLLQYWALSRNCKYSPVSSFDEKSHFWDSSICHATCISTTKSTQWSVWQMYIHGICSKTPNVNKIAFVTFKKNPEHCQELVVDYCPRAATKQENLCSSSAIVRNFTDLSFPVRGKWFSQSKAQSTRNIIAGQIVSP